MARLWVGLRARAWGLGEALVRIAGRFGCALPHTGGGVGGARVPSQCCEAPCGAGVLRPSAPSAEWCVGASSVYVCVRRVTM